MRNAENRQTGSAMRENLEAVLLAIVLALAIREYVFQAFKIPSGSMAPTLLGQHKDLTCPNCGMWFPVNGQSVAPERDRRLVMCPNCGYAFEQRIVDSATCTHFPARPERLFWKGYYRVLAERVSYNIHPPERWDVIVFKPPPSEGEVNFIKRVVGLPGEMIQVRRGNVFTSEGPALSLVEGIARKPRSVQEDVWIPVYDASHVEREQKAFYPHWMREAGALDQPDPVTILLRPDGQGRAAARFDQPQLWTFLAYNRLETPYAPTGEIKFDCALKPPERGRVRIVMQQDGHEYACELARESADMARVSMFVERQMVADTANVPFKDWTRLAFCHADGTIWADVNGRELMRHEFVPPTDTLPSSYSAGLSLETIEGEAYFREIRVWRDIYYTSVAMESQNGGRFGLATPLTIPNDCCFVMGDNVSHSKDSRFWGFVANRDIFGKAFLIWWPVGELRAMR